ncbi:MAG: hypothetical protein HKM93_19520 [Desulfobacteraceae bacterium]|nr:hypothetical protein [Desulfobacteraceae bacterium]
MKESISGAYRIIADMMENNRVDPHHEHHATDVWAEHVNPFRKMGDDGLTWNPDNGYPAMDRRKYHKKFILDFYAIHA